MVHLNTSDRQTEHSYDNFLSDDVNYEDANLRRNTSKREEQFIAVRGKAKVGQAIAALQVKGGQSWWHLLVHKDDDTWGVTRFSDLYNALESITNAAEIRLGDWHGLVTATAVEQMSMDTRPAEMMAARSSARVLVVTESALPVGILVESVTRAGTSVPSAQLSELGGKYANLKDYGSILLSSSKK